MRSNFFINLFFVKTKSRSIIILSILFGYIVLQFLWWEVLLVKQSGQIIAEKQKIAELSFINSETIKEEVNKLHKKKETQTIMIVGEGTVFLLLLLFGIYKIKQANTKELELSNQQKNFFLSITHELKTPIASTKLQLQTLLKHQLNQQTQNELINNALIETERLNTLIDNVLLTNHLDSGEFVFKKETENLSDLIENTLHRYYKNEINNGDIKLDIEKDIFLSIDKTVFPSIVTNLIDNALKYSFKEKKIKLKLCKKENQLYLTVSDAGCGIADNEKSKIFNRFYRAGNEETRKAKGTGLGLYIVKYLAENHSAKLTVNDNVPNGSIFEIIFSNPI